MNKKLQYEKKNLLHGEQPHSSQFDLTPVLIFKLNCIGGIDIHLHFAWKHYTD
jgi:hypothetical protein